MPTDKQLKDYLEWSITPQDEEESELFKKENLVDDYIELKNRIPLMSRAEVILELNKQLAPYGLEVDE